MPFKQPTLDELEARRLAWHEHGDGPGHYRKRCGYAPCSGVFYAERVTGRYCTWRCYRNARQMRLWRCGYCGRLFEPYVRARVSGRWVTIQRLWCSAPCRRNSWAYEQRHGSRTYSYPASEYKRRFKGREATRFPRKKGRVMRPIRW